jgi:malate dehydrogenase (oxaloacetate-decarboxylating)(NADP+)
MGRDGVTPEAAKAAVRRSNTLIAALMLRRGEADGMLCGLVGRYDSHLEHMRTSSACKPGVRTLAAMNALMLDQHTLFIADTFVNEEPERRGAGRHRAMAAVRGAALRHAAEGGVPVAFDLRLVAAAVGAAHARGARPVRAARADIECDGEMHGDAALSRSVRRRLPAGHHAHGSANLLVLPNLDAANILFNVLKMTGGHGVTVGPMLLGTALPAHILTPSATVRRIVNMTALAVADAADAARSVRGRGAALDNPPPSPHGAAPCPRHQDRRHPRPRLVSDPRCWSACCAPVWTWCG